MNPEQLMYELLRLKRCEHILWAAIISVALVCLVVSALEWHTVQTLAHRQTLTLRRLDIVDQSGVSRVILAAPAPPPTRFGKLGKRDGVVSGILLTDATGTERGGYVTSDGEDANALFTLDAQGKQTVLLLAEPRGNTLLRLWNRDKGSLVMGVSDSEPFLNVRQNDKIFLSAPTNNRESHDSRPLFR